MYRWFAEIKGPAEADRAGRGGRREREGEGGTDSDDETREGKARCEARLRLKEM